MPLRKSQRAAAICAHPADNLALRRQKSALLSALSPQIYGSMMDFDMNWWGLYAMPVGVLLCFGPVLIAWALAERSSRNSRERR